MTEKKNYASMSRPALLVEIATMQSAMNGMRGEIVKQQVVSATLRDVVRMLGFMMSNKDQDPMKVAPALPEVRKLVAAHLDELASHFTDLAKKMREDELQNESE